MWLRKACVAGVCVAFGACGTDEASDIVGGGSNGSPTTLNGGVAEGGVPSTGGNQSPTTGQPSVATGSSGSGTSTGQGTMGGISGGEECTRFVVRSDRAAPDMLIVMDASGSMVGATGGAMRWGPAVDAVNTVVRELEHDIQFGLMTFPANAMGCDAGQLDVPLAVMNAQPIANALGGILPALGSTPTSTTLAQARQVLEQREPVKVGEFALPRYIMLVTDGDPNCVDVRPTGGIDDLLNGIDDLINGGGGGMMGGGMMGNGPDVGAQQASIEEITSLANQNILTYVIGYDTAGTTFAPVLDQMAAVGGTGDTMHRSVSSGDELVEEFRSITSGAVSCSFVLQQEVDVRRINVYVDGELTEIGTDWTLRDDGRTVDLLDTACNALQVGAEVEAEVVCEDVNII